MSPSPSPPPAGPSSAPAPAQPHPQIPLAGAAQSAAPGAQRPTLANTHIRSVGDAQRLFYAVQRGLLPKVERRLDAAERKRLRPGDVYVWEERGATGLFAGAPGGGAVVAQEGMAGPAEAAGYEVGIERWTEGLSWSASRIRDEFLIYFENVKKKERGVDREGHRARSLENQVLRDGDRDMYIKQTYSVLRLDVNQEEGPSSASAAESISSTSAAGSGDKKDVKRKPRKWHLNAYFTKSTEGNLNTIDTIPWLRDLVVPEGIFTSARQSKKTSGAAAAAASSSSSAAGPASASTSQTKLDSTGEDSSSLGKRSRAAPAVQRTYAAFPIGDRRAHPRPVVPAPPPPPPPLPPGASPAPSGAFSMHPAPSHPPTPAMVQAEELHGAPSGAAPGAVPGSMHVLVPVRAGGMVQTVPLEPIDTSAVATARGGATSPVSAGGVHGSTVGLFRMNLGEGTPDERMETDAQPDAQGFDRPGASFGASFGDATLAAPSAFGRGGFEFGQQQQQLRELQRFQERQRQQQRFQEQQQRQFYPGTGFELDPAQPFQPPAHGQHLLHPASPHAYSPHQAHQALSPAHTALSPALSEFRASSEYSHSSSSSSSRGGSVSSGSGSARIARPAGAWPPAGAGAAAAADFGFYHIKSEYSELGMAFGAAAGPSGVQGAEGHFEGFGGGFGDEEEDEDLSGYLPMPPLPAALTEPAGASASAGRRRRGSRRSSDAARGRQQLRHHRGDRPRVDVVDMRGLAIQAYESFVEDPEEYYPFGAVANGSGSALAFSHAHGSPSSLVDALSMSAPPHAPAMSPASSAPPSGARSPTMALPSVPSVPSAPPSVPAIPSVPSVPPQPITMPSIPLVPAPLPGAEPPLDVAPAGGEGAGKGRRALAPLHQLQRAHPYRRSQLDDRLLRQLGPVPAPGAK